MEENFFKEQTQSSRIKASIVAEYFPQYCKIILKKEQNEIRYLDLFAGPGIYDDGNPSTPFFIAKAIAEDNILSQKVRLLFNDNTQIEKLKANFNSHFKKDSFHFEPRFGNRTIGEDQEISNYLNKVYHHNKDDKNPYPTLLFFDPFGYKGIDTTILSNFLKNWGNELFLFLNTKRINPALDNDKFDELMLSLFPNKIDNLRLDKKFKSRVNERLNLIIETLASEFAINVKGKLFHTAFRFQEEDSSGTSHFIIHFTKHPKGYELIKQVFNEFDNIGATLDNDGVYSFDAKKMEGSSLSLDFGDQNIQNLAEILESKYKGKTIPAKKLFEEDQPLRKYCGKHYSLALRNLVERGIVKSTFNDNSSHKVSVLITTDKCILKFN